MQGAKPETTRGRIALSDVDLRDRWHLGHVPVGGSSLELVAGLARHKSEAAESQGMA